MSQDQRLFERGSEWDQSGRKFRSHYVIHCSSCGDQDVIRFNRFNRSLPPDIIAKQFHSKGWVIGSTRRNDLCPRCVSAVTGDRQRRKEVAVAAKRKAHADLTIAQSKVPLPPNDQTVRREHYVLVDRLRETERQITHVEAMLEELIVQAANLHVEHDAIMKRLTDGVPTSAEFGGSPPPPEPQEPPEMFTPIPVRAESTSTSDDRVSISYQARAGVPRTIIKIGRAIAQQLGFLPASHVQILEGEGDDAGFLQLISSENGSGYKVQAPKTGNSHTVWVSSSYVRPRSQQHIDQVEVAHEIDNGALRLRLPAAYA